MIKEINKYKSTDIANKQFVTEVKGYKMEDVDDFLDDVQKDYIYFQNTIDELKEQIDSISKQLITSKTDLSVFKEQTKHLTDSYIELTKNSLANSDVFKRFQNIETAIKNLTETINKKLT